MEYYPSISSHALGRAWLHSLPSKLAAASAHNYMGVEVFYEDLCTLAKELPGNPSPQTPILTPENQIQAAKIIRQWLDSYNLIANCLQPFMHYEGLTDRSKHAEKLEEAKLWFQLAAILGTDLILVPSNFLSEGVSGDFSLIVSDMVELADLALQQEPPIRFTYEALCWGRFIDTWEQAWEVVQAVDRPNFGLCIDTFNIAGRIYADPSTPSGKTPTADADFAASMQRLAKIDGTKVFFVQLVDAERLEKPMVPGHEWWVDGQPPRMSWSRKARAFPFEETAYLPVIDILRVVTQDLGYRGWISFELFSRTMEDKSERCPEEHAVRGMVSWAKVARALGWEESKAPVEEDCDRARL
jgi:4-hydroxyphenylpyruvate dioxygenase